MSARAIATEALEPERAVLVPQLALALWIWEAAQLEPGETAVYTSGSPVDRCVAAMASLRSMRDVIRLDVSGSDWKPMPGVTNRPISDPQEVSRWLSEELRRSPGVVAAILTPESQAADILLEALPMWARIVLAVPSSQPATIDFYNNVHRKGTLIVSVPGSLDELYEPQWSAAASQHLARAIRILRTDRLASQCLP